MTASEPQAEHERFGALFNLMATIEVPTARPNFSRRDEALGLTLLSLALRLKHVIRVTEALTLTNTDHLSRTVSVDVDLQNLTLHQRKVVAAHDLGPGSDPRHEEGVLRPARGLWVPIARHSREDLAPVVVRDGSGDAVPRLTQIAATSAVVAGVTRLFRSQAQSLARLEPTSDNNTRVYVGDSSVAVNNEEDHQARWLVELAIEQLIEHGRNTERKEYDERDLEDPVRAQAAAYLRLMPQDQARHFSDLLRAASREYFLTVMLPAADPRQFLTYEAPLIPAVRSLTGRRRAWRSVLPVSTEFTVNYFTQVPRSVGSYHVTIDVPEEIDVRRFILSSNADKPAIDDLTGRIETAAAHAKGRSSQSRALEVERRELEATLGTLARRRLIDVDAFNYYLRNRKLAERVPKWIDKKIRSLRSSPSASSLTRLAELHGAKAERSRGWSARPLLKPDELADAGALLADAQLGLDVSTDNDPRENGAHAQWRPIPLGFGHVSVEPVEARIYIAMADEPPALVESVARMLGALLLVVVGIKTVALDHPAKWFDPLSLGQADAAVAVLLIVPGLLLGRLDIHSTHSVLARLRRFPLLVAYLSVITTTFLAIFVAAQNDVNLGAPDGTAVNATQHARLSSAFTLSAALLSALLVLCLVERLVRWARRRVRVPRSPTIPTWLRYEYAPLMSTRGTYRPLRSTLSPDVYFDAIRPVPNTTRTADREYEERRASWDSDPTGQGPNVTEGPALLAELAARAVFKDYKAAWLEVMHGRAAPPGDLSEDSDDLFYLTFAGTVCQVTSGYRKQYQEPSSGSMIRLEHQDAPQDEKHVLQVWHSTSPVPPAVIRPAAFDLDLLVDFSHLDSAERSAQMMAFLSEALEYADGKVLPTLVMTPAASTAADPATHGRDQQAVARTLRLTFSIPQDQHATRLGLEINLAELAARANVGLWRASRRPGAGQGDWQQVRAAAQPSTTLDRGPEAVVLVPITFLGTRGPESASSFRLLVDALRAGSAPVRSLTATVVGQHALVHLVLEGDVRTSRSHQEPSDGMDASAAFSELERRKLVAPIEGKALESIQFSACIGVPVEISGTGDDLNQGGPSPQPHPLDSWALGRRSLWIDWEIPVRSHAGRALATNVIEQCSKIGPTEILYWRVHRTPDDRVRGRAKLGVQTDHRSDAAGGPGQSLGERAKTIQSELARLMIDETPNLDGHTIYLHVVWSEPWLVRRRGV